MAINKTYKEEQNIDGERTIEVNTTGIERREVFTHSQLINRKAQLQKAIDEIETILSEFK